MFSSIFKQLLPKAQCAPTPQATTSIPISAPAMAISPFLLQRPSSARLSAFLDSNSSNTKPSSPTCPASASSISSTIEATPSSGICPGSNLSYTASNPKKQRKTITTTTPNNSCYFYSNTPYIAERSLQLIISCCGQPLYYAFFGFLRSGEITIPTFSSYDPTVHLNYNDISVDNPANPSIVKVWLKCSKTDPFSHGVDVHVGKTGQVLCPISALLNYLAVHGKEQGLLFHFSDGSPLSISMFVDKFHALLHQAGIDGSLYSGHSSA